MNFEFRKYAIFVVSSWAIVLLLALIKPEKSGLVGDTMNVLTALFTGLTLVGLVTAILIQREELKEIKEDRKDTQQMLEEQKLQTGELKKTQNIRNKIDEEERYVRLVHNAIEIAMKQSSQIFSSGTKRFEGKNYRVDKMGDSASHDLSLAAHLELSRVYLEHGKLPNSSLSSRNLEVVGHIALMYGYAYRVASDSPVEIRANLQSAVLYSTSSSLAVLFEHLRVFLPNVFEGDVIDYFEALKSSNFSIFPFNVHE